MSEFKRLAIPHAGHERRRTQYGYSAYWTQASKFELMNRLGEYEDTGFTPEEIRGMIRDEPRVMTVEELPGWDGAVLIEERTSNRLTWALYLDEYYPALRFQDVGCVIVLPTSEYGVGWRCWTARPNEEEREAEPWM